MNLRALILIWMGFDVDRRTMDVRGLLSKRIKLLFES